jgi:hypothetical protein
MKWTQVCPLLGVVLFACATGENQNPDAIGLGTAGNDADGNTAGTARGVTAQGGPATSGSSTGGTFTFSGTSSFAGTFATAGTAAGGTGTGGTAAGGAGGSGGKASGGAAGSGGKASGGAAGSGGSGGGGNAMCAGTTVPAKTTWKGTASMSDNAYPPAKVFDGDNGTRWSTGTKQVGGEWLQIDFGTVVTLNEITMHTNNDDYFRHYQVRLSNTSQDFAAPILKEADGVTGTIVVPLAAAKAGQYLTIRQTGMVAAGEIAWWSLHEVSVACK